MAQSGRTATKSIVLGRGWKSKRRLERERELFALNGRCAGASNERLLPSEIRGLSRLRQVNPRSERRRWASDRQLCEPRLHSGHFAPASKLIRLAGGCSGICGRRYGFSEALWQS